MVLSLVLPRVYADTGAAPLALTLFRLLLIAGVILFFSLGSLPTLYAVPKQASRQSIERVLNRAHEGEILVPVGLARAGRRFYAPRLAVDERLERGFERIGAGIDPRDGTTERYGGMIPGSTRSTREPVSFLSSIRRRYPIP